MKTIDIKKIRKLKHFSQRKELSRNIWLTIFAILICLFIISTLFTINLYQQPISAKETKKVLNYTSSSQFDYITKLKNNTVYNKTYLHPNEGIIFKQIVENISGIHHYRFQINKTSTITISYSLSALIKTELWTKTFTLIPSKTIIQNGTVNAFTETFPIDYKFFDSVLTNINDEIGITAPNPILLIRASITVSAKNAEYEIYESYTPEITMSLNQKTIDFSEILSTTQSGSRTRLISIDNPGVIEARSNSFLSSIGFMIIIIIFTLFTKIESSNQSIIDKKIKKIRKKYGEYIVDLDEISSSLYKDQKKISVKNIEDLVKISEEIGKPIFRFFKENKHIFYVNDEHIFYTYIFS